MLGIAVTQTREPGGSPGAEVIRHVILSGAAKPLGAEAEAMLFAAARDDHIAHTIQPALDRGALGGLRSLRRFDARLSGRARPCRSAPDQAAGKDHGRRPTGPTSPSSSMRRPRSGLRAPMRDAATARVDRFESEDIGFHERLRDAYRQLADRRAGALRADRCQRHAGAGDRTRLGGR